MAAAAPDDAGVLHDPVTHAAAFKQLLLSMLGMDADALTAQFATEAKYEQVISACKTTLCEVVQREHWLDIEAVYLSIARSSGAGKRPRLTATELPVTWVLQLLCRIGTHSHRARCIMKHVKLHRLLGDILECRGVTGEPSAQDCKYTVRLLSTFVAHKETALDILQCKDAGLLTHVLRVVHLVPDDVLHFITCFLRNSKMFVRALLDVNVCAVVCARASHDRAAVKVLVSLMHVLPEQVGAQMSAVVGFAEQLISDVRRFVQSKDADGQPEESEAERGRLSEMEHLFGMCCSHSFDMRSALAHAGLLQSLAAQCAQHTTIPDYWAAVACEFANEAFGRQASCISEVLFEILRDSGLLKKLVCRFGELVAQVDALDDESAELGLLNKLCDCLPCFIYDQTGLTYIIHDTDFLPAMHTWVESYVHQYKTPGCPSPHSPSDEQQPSTSKCASPNYREVEQQILATREQMEKDYNVDMPLARSLWPPFGSPYMSSRRSSTSPQASASSWSPEQNWSPTASSVHSYMSNDDLLTPSSSVHTQVWNESSCLERVLVVLSWMSHAPVMPPIACSIGLIRSLVNYAVKVREAHARTGRMLKRLMRDYNLFNSLLDAHVAWSIGLNHCGKSCCRRIQVDETSFALNIDNEADMRAGKKDWLNDKMQPCAQCRRECRIGCLLLTELQKVAESAFGMGALRQRLNASDAWHTMLALPFLLKSTASRESLLRATLGRMCDELARCQDVPRARHMLGAIMAVPRTDKLTAFLSAFVPDYRVRGDAVEHHCAHSQLELDPDDTNTTMLIRVANESTTADRALMSAACGYYEALLRQGGTYRDTTGSEFVCDLDASIQSRHVSALVHQVHGCDWRCSQLDICASSELECMYRLCDMYLCASCTHFLSTWCLLPVLLHSFNAPPPVDFCSHMECLFAAVESLYSCEQVLKVLIAFACSTHASTHFDVVLEDDRLRASLAAALNKHVPAFM